MELSMSILSRFYLLASLYDCKQDSSLTRLC